MNGCLQSLVALVLLAGCALDQTEAAQPKPRAEPRPSPFVCEAHAGWEHVADATNLAVDLCKDHAFSQIPPLAERVTASAGRVTIVEIDSNPNPCEPYPRWGVAVTGSTVELRLYAPAVTEAGDVMCIQVIQPYLLRFQVKGVPRGPVTVKVRDEQTESTTVTVK